MKVEICANSLRSALDAQAGGADRIELCDNLFEGGTTPSAATIQLARKHLTIGLFVLIRPRGGDFLYNDLEFELMKKDIELAKKAKVDGVVIGMLQRDGQIDLEGMAQLIKAAGDLEITFHRAFDYVPDPQLALEQLIKLGVHRVLTSGQQPTAQEGIELIKTLVEQAGKRIIVMPGSGITEHNIQFIAQSTRATEYHLSAKKLYRTPARYAHNTALLSGGSDIPELDYFVTDPLIVRKVKMALNSL